MYTKSNTLLPRDLLVDIEPFVERDEIVLILGARQVGKTSLLRYIEKKLGKEGQSVFFIDFEDIELRGAIRSSRELLSYLKGLGHTGGHAYVFLDEVHYMHDATSILKYLHDHHPELKFFVTGSSSLKLHLKLEESLTGRKAVFHLYPLSFREYLVFSGNEDIESSLVTFNNQTVPDPFLGRICSAYNDYILWGGYPKVATTGSLDVKARILREIFATYLEKEVRAMVKEEMLERFDHFVRFLSFQNGNLLKILEVSKELGIQRPTVQRYLKILEETFMATRLFPIARNRAKELTRMPKLYFFDSGFINFLLKDFRPLTMHPNLGSLVETCVFTALLRKLSPLEDIRFWRTKSGQEVDFVIRTKGNQVPVEVKWQNDLRIETPMRNFIEEYNPAKAIISTKSVWSTRKAGSCEVRFVPAWAIGDLWDSWNQTEA
jgi:predicted AAA+ superfamily ATPase